MPRQHSAPYLLTGSASHKLEPVHDIFKETWLQEFIFGHCQALPIDEVER